MRKLLILLFLILLSLTASAGRSASRSASGARLNAIISNCRHYDGADVVRLGWLGTAAARSVVKLASISDPEACQALEMIRGVKNFTYLGYEGCAPEICDWIDHEVHRALEGFEMLMEFKDGESTMRMFGVVDERQGRVVDFVLHNSADRMLVYVSGFIPMDAIGRLMADD
ncbi:MAG: DUF4252 domain-containing protein [Bacteroidales bacterium]|nr:DUF4252 domain-containing protein [Bacteroidales bacterium]